MKYIVIPMLAIALTGCGGSAKRLNLTKQTLSADLILATYEYRNPSEDANTTVYELRRLRGDHSLIVSMIYADSHGRLITLAGTPVTSDNILCDPGIFQLGFVPDVPMPELHLFVDRRGNVSSKTVESHDTKEASALRTRSTEAVLVVDSRPLDDHLMKRVLQLAAPKIVTVTTEQGAPVDKLLEMIKQFAHQTEEIRIAMLPWHWANTATLVDDTQEAPQGAHRAY